MSHEEQWFIDLRKNVFDFLDNASTEEIKAAFEKANEGCNYEGNESIFGDVFVDIVKDARIKELEEWQKQAVAGIETMIKANSGYIRRELYARLVKLIQEAKGEK